MSAGTGAPSCAYCGAHLRGLQRKFCSRLCNRRWWCEETARLASLATQTARHERARSGACLDCQGPLTAAPRGPLPTRCRPCKAAWDAQRLIAARETYDARQAAKARRRRKRLRCVDCRGAIDRPVKARGRVPQRCQVCHASHEKARHDRDQQARRQRERMAAQRRRWPLLWGGAL